MTDMTRHAAGKSLDVEQDLAVVFNCVWCGKTVEIKTSAGASELADAQAFVAEHADCLRRITQRSGDSSE